MLSRAYPHRVTYNLRPTVRSGPKTYDLRAQVNQPIVVVGRLVVQCDSYRHVELLLVLLGQKPTPRETPQRCNGR